MSNKNIDINEIRQYATQNIEVGQEIYIPRKGYCFYFTKEKVTKISPKRTRLTTDKSGNPYNFNFEVYPVDNEEVNAFVHKANKLNFMVLNLREMCGNQLYHVSAKKLLITCWVSQKMNTKSCINLSILLKQVLKQ